MSTTTVYREAFTHSINLYIDDLVNHPEIGNFTLILTAVFVLILFFLEVSKFMLTGFELESHIQSAFMVFFTLAFLKGFPTAFDIAYETLDNLGLLFLKVGTGNTDPFFLSKFVSKTLAYINPPDTSIFNMAASDLLLAGVWWIVSMLLQLVMMLVAAWATWTLALGKMLGVLFIPMLILPATRPVFDGWLKFVVGSLMLLVTLRAAGVLVGLGFRAQYIAVGVLNCTGTGFNTCTFVAKGSASVAMRYWSELIVTMVIGIALVISCIGITQAMVGGAASPSKAVGRGAGQLAGKAANMQMMKSLFARFMKS
ncbi:hypothetical protein [Vibrio sp. WXL103]|uniref:hypothetical protein n=1 Tax=unclassified Vibrio TaxID=2614977 RepID=UPI003EC8042F